MGQAKNRGSLKERQEQSREQRAKEIVVFKKALDIPNDATFLGYVVQVIETEDYLAKIEESEAAFLRKYTITPELALTYSDRSLALKTAVALPKRARVGLLFDTGTQLHVGFDEN